MAARKKKQYRDPVTGRFAKRPAIPRDPVTGRFIPRSPAVEKPDTYFVSSNVLGLGRPLDTLKKEYSAMRKLALRRIKALEASGRDMYYGSAFYEMKRASLKTLKEFRTDEAFLRAYRSAWDWLYGSRKSTISGQESIIRDTLETLQRRGYDFINRENLSDFGEFMNTWRKQYDNAQLDSERVAILWKFTSAKGIDPDIVLQNFEDYMKRYAGTITRSQKAMR